MPEPVSGVDAILDGLRAAQWDAADLVAAHLRERWPCTCRPGMDGGGVYHAADCNSRREGSQAVLAVIRLLRAATPPASPDERLREALALVYVMLTGAEPMWAEMPLDERCARAANEAQQAVLAAADREAPDECRAPHCFSEYGTPCGTCPVLAASADKGWSPGIDDPEPPALGDIDTGEGWYQT